MTSSILAEAELILLSSNRVHAKDKKINAGAKPIDIVLMFKVVVLQHLHNLSDDRIEY